MVFHIQEHDELPEVLRPRSQRSEYESKSLFKWFYSEQEGGRYQAYFRIGAELLGDGDSLVVMPKVGLDTIDWPRMLFSCFETEDVCDSGFGQIYNVDLDSGVIHDKAIPDVITPMVVIHFIVSVQRIVGKGLKYGPVVREDNLRKVKGRIRFAQNLRRNQLVGREDRIFCRYEERSIDIYENRLLKKALLVSSRICTRMRNHGYTAIDEIDVRLRRCLSAFETVGDELPDIRCVKFKRNRLYKEYGTALRLAHLILKMCDNVVNRFNGTIKGVPPFWIDMSLLYEHYVWGLLRVAYGNKIIYQAQVDSGHPDFLYVDETAPQILDTKYKLCYNDNWTSVTEDIRQLSGYARDRSVLERLGIHGRAKQDATVVPCVIVYPSPDDSPDGCRHFDGRRSPVTQLQFSREIPNYVGFYKLKINLPRIGEAGV